DLPTRAAIMTGKAPARTHLTDFISGTPFPYARLLQPKWRRSLPLKEKTLAERLTEHGYATALFGKWHLAKSYTPPLSVPLGPDRQGFGETFITHKPTDDSDPEADAHGVKAITDRALDFIDRHHDRPFFLLLAPNTIHSPIMAPASLVEKHRKRPGSDLPHNHPTIAAMMEQLDQAIGVVLAKIENLGLSETTLVIFASDNGGSLRDTTQAPLRGGKAQLYEGGLRVPLIMRWSGTIPAARTTEFPTTSADLFPTILEVTGTPVPVEEPRDGISLLNTMRGQPSSPARTLFWHYPHYHNAGVHGPASALRQGDWKLIHYYEAELTGQGTADELFNLRDDPGETINLADVQPDRLRSFRSELTALLTEAGAQLPSVNDRYDPTRTLQSTADAEP
ncbi:MAG TPA: sulfatase-like hydrolase/transferase, partial [Opitutus sp.]|nr:sulfatase-like hydrolase/transferase [Opitutus sp.]